MNGVCDLFFSLTKQQQKNVETKDLYEQLYSIVLTLLKHELPDLNARHHLLYTANVQLEQYRHNQQYHRQRTSHDSAIGQFHQQCYEYNVKRFNQLRLLIDSYVHLSVEDERQHFNHRLKMQDRMILLLHDELQEKQQISLPAPLEEQFWDALKEDLLPVLATLDC